MNVLGIGIDAASISYFQQVMDSEGLDGPFIRRTFTALEREYALARYDKAAYFAARFAAKEAVFKALSPLLGKDSFDLRIVETLHAEDGSPYINTQGPLEHVLQRAGVSGLLLSVTTEADLATAFVLAGR